MPAGPRRLRALPDAAPDRTRRALLAAPAGLLVTLADGAAAGLALADLPGWEGSDHAPALALWHRVAGAAPPADPAALALSLRPVLAAGPEETLVTGYYEPVLAASPVPAPGFAVPLLAMPEGWEGPMPDRRAIEAGALGAHARPLFWLGDPVDLFFLQVQGSGRLRLPDGRLVRVGYAGRNGHPYVSLGAILVAEGHLPREGITADLVKDWLRADPARGAAMMARNPSYVFFEERSGLAPGDGPLGAMGLPLVAGISCAVDPAHHPLGSLLWVERADLARGALLVAMDTGSAIRGPGRIDVFHGTGDAAGTAAGALLSRGRVFRLEPARP